MMYGWVPRAGNRLAERHPCRLRDDLAAGIHLAFAICGLVGTRDFEDSEWMSKRPGHVFLTRRVDASQFKRLWVDAAAQKPSRQWQRSSLRRKGGEHNDRPWGHQAHHRVRRKTLCTERSSCRPRRVYLRTENDCHTRILTENLFNLNIPLCQRALRHLKASKGRELNATTLGQRTVKTLF